MCGCLEKNIQNKNGFVKYQRHMLRAIQVERIWPNPMVFNVVMCTLDSYDVTRIPRHRGIKLKAACNRAKPLHE